jgi:hypothetical protein
LWEFLGQEGCLAWDAGGAHALLSPLGYFGQPLERQGRAQEVAAEVLNLGPRVRGDGDLGMEGEALQASSGEPPAQIPRSSDGPCCGGRGLAAPPGRPGPGRSLAWQRPQVSTAGRV